MNKIFPVCQIGLAALLLIIAGATLVNMLLIALRPETISVVNVFIGQIIMIASFTALATILFRKGRARLRELKVADASQQLGDRQAGS